MRDTATSVQQSIKISLQQIPLFVQNLPLVGEGVPCIARIRHNIIKVVDVRPKMDRSLVSIASVPYQVLTKNPLQGWKNIILPTFKQCFRLSLSFLTAEDFVANHTREMFSTDFVKASDYLHQLHTTL
jgi:hypothetical protein